MNDIHESIKHLAFPIDKMIPLPGNPREGDVDVIVASYQTFGQVRPIVVKDNNDGTVTVIAGNHQVEACKLLGWTEMAVTYFDGDNSKAIAYSLADNRTSELGTTNNDTLFEMIDQVSDEYSELFDKMGWDDFEMAVIGNDYFTDDDNTGFTPPVMVDYNPNLPTAQVTVVSGDNPKGETELTAPSGTDTDMAVTQGAPSVVHNGSKTVVQYTIIFDSSDQQRKWYDFIRWLKTDPSIDGESTAERVINFIDAHTDI